MAEQEGGAQRGHHYDLILRAEEEEGEEQQHHLRFLMAEEAQAAEEPRLDQLVDLAEAAVPLLQAAKEAVVEGEG